MVHLFFGSVLLSPFFPADPVCLIAGLYPANQPLRLNLCIHGFIEDLNKYKRCKHWDNTACNQKNSNCVNKSIEHVLGCINERNYIIFQTGNEREESIGIFFFGISTCGSET